VSRKALVLPFGVPDIDERLPGGGLAYGALHEVAGGGSGTVDGAAAALFTAGINGYTSSISSEYKSTRSGWRQTI
jgi:protein ImuA